MGTKTNINSAPKTRFEKRKARSKGIVLMAGVGSILGLLFVLCVSYLIINDYHKHESKTDLAAAKSADPTKTSKLQNGKKPNDNGKNSTKNNSDSSNLSSTNYILPDSDKKVLSQEDIASLTKEQLRLARNEIYARHGYIFESLNLQKYFSSKSWYTEDPSYQGSLNKVEKENVMYLKEKGDS